MKKHLLLITTLVLMIPLTFLGQQLENPGFETWEPITGGLYEPVDWSTIKTADNPTIAALAPVTYEQSADAHSGNYSIKLYNVNAFGFVATGAICNGRFHAEFDIDASYSYTDTTDAQWHTPFTARPDSLAGWFKYFPQGNDRAQFKVVLHVGECKMPENGTLPNWVGTAVYNTAPGVTYNSWTRFSVPFQYFNSNTPSYLLCVINSGDSTSAIVDSYMLADDLELIYKPSGISDPVTSGSFVTVYDDYLMINLESEEDFLNNQFYLTDMAGQQILTVRLSGRKINLPAHLKEGAYVAVLQGKSNKFTQKVLIR